MKWMFREIELAARRAYDRAGELSAHLSQDAE